MSAKLPEAATLLASTPPRFSSTCTDVLSKAKAQVAELVALPPGSDGRVLSLYDELTTSVSNMAQRAGLAREVHPDEAFRQACEGCEQALDAFSVELAQNRAVYQALSKVDPKGLDAVTTFWLFKTRREFRRAGVDRDDATRAKVKALNEELVKLGQAFGRNIRDDVRTIRVAPADLDGLPKDWLDAHPAGPDGKVAVTTNTPDYLPVMTYAHGPRVREALWRAYRARAAPANQPVLEALLARRHELATLLGYASWAAYATETKMVKTPEAARDFIERGRTSTQARATADLKELLERKRLDAPMANALAPWDFGYYEDRVKAESYGLDSQTLRAYFEYSNVKRGVMETTARLFSLRFEPVKGAVVWHPDVETFDLYQADTDTRLGRLHLDMHPRDGKYKHAAEFGVTTGRAGQELPEAALVCNFPRPGGLMQHSEVETFFHEFGHLLHELLAGRQRWGGVSGIRTEWDFVEVPSMLLQEWPFDERVLAGFATHFETKAPIPPQLVAQLRAARDFGVGLATRRQFFLSDVSLTLHERPGLEPNRAVQALQERFLPMRPEWVEGTHFVLGFGHLDGYSAAYYTYLWSTVIAKDLLTRFSSDMLDSNVATDYRRKVLEPGGSKEAGLLVQDFLGRPYSFDAFESWLNQRR